MDKFYLKFKKEVDFLYYNLVNQILILDMILNYKMIYDLRKQIEYVVIIVFYRILLR